MTQEDCDQLISRLEEGDCNRAYYNYPAETLREAAHFAGLRGYKLVIDPHLFSPRGTVVIRFERDEQIGPGVQYALDVGVSVL